MRSKREKRLRAIRREIVQPFYDEKEAAKLSAQEAALAAPKLQVPVRPSTTMEISTSTVANTNSMGNTLSNFTLFFQFVMLCS